MGVVGYDDVEMNLLEFIEEASGFELAFTLYL